MLNLLYWVISMKSRENASRKHIAKDPFDQRDVAFQVMQVT